MLIKSMVFIAFYLLFAVSGQAKEEIWSDFHEHDLNKEKLEKIINGTKYEHSPVTKGYKGLCETMMAEHVFLPTSKLKNFNNGKKKIEEAVYEWPKNSELRYIRLMVQLNCPSFLNYNKNIDADLNYFCHNFVNEKASQTHGVAIIDNLRESDGLTTEQRKQLEDLKRQL